jgi:hypothetical protein
MPIFYATVGASALLSRAVAEVVRDALTWVSSRGARAQLEEFDAGHGACGHAPSDAILRT